MALDSFLVESGSPSVVLLDGDRLDHALRLRAREIDRQQPVLEVGTEHIHAVCEHESALELPRGDAAMQVLPSLVVLLASADDELVFLDAHVELFAGEAGYRERDAKALGILGVAGDALDVVGRITVGPLGDAIERSLDLVKSEQERTGKRRNSGHVFKVLVSDFAGAHGAPRYRKYGGRPLRVQESAGFGGDLGKSPANARFRRKGAVPQSKKSAAGWVAR